MDGLIGIEALFHTAGDHPLLSALLYSAVSSLTTLIRYHLLFRDQLRQAHDGAAGPTPPAVAFDLQAVTGVILFASLWPCSLTFAAGEWIFGQIADRVVAIGRLKVLTSTPKGGDQA